MSEVVAHIAAGRIIAILRRTDIAHSGAELARQLVGLGVRSIEVTLDQPGAMNVISQLAASLPAHVLLGGGTVTTTAQVRELAHAGARFTVSPHTDPGLIGEARRLDMLPIPGAMTPTEISRAVDAGARLVKLFPAGPLGIPYLRALRGPFAQVGFVPTGGIRVAEVTDWLGAGAIAVGLGSELTSSEGPPRELAAILAGSP